MYILPEMIRDRLITRAILNGQKRPGVALAANQADTCEFI